MVPHSSRPVTVGILASWALVARRRRLSVPGLGGEPKRRTA